MNTLNNPEEWILGFDMDAQSGRVYDNYTGQPVKLFKTASSTAQINWIVNDGVQTNGLPNSTVWDYTMDRATGHVNYEYVNIPQHGYQKFNLTGQCNVIKAFKPRQNLL